MRRPLFIAVALALPLAAQDAGTTPTQPAPAQETVQQADSPLVAAAKRANRKGKKPTTVITNATLRQSGASAHVTTTTNQATLNMPKAEPPPRPTPEMEARAALIAKEEAARAKKQEEARQRAAAKAEHELFEDDEMGPSRAETQAEDSAAQKPPGD